MAGPTRYRDLEAPSLIDVGRRATPTGSADVAARLADSFASFSRMGSDVGAQLSANVGGMRGAEAGAAGPPKMRSSLTAFGKAYNDSALRSYAIKAEADANETAARLEVEAGTDPERFRKAMDEVRRATLSEAPAEARALVDEVYVRRSSQGLSRIQGALAAEIRDEGRRLISEDIAQRVERISVLRAQDDDASFAESVEEQTKLQLMIDGAVNTGDLSPTEGAVLLQGTQRDIVFNVVKQRFRNELDDPLGDPIGMIENVREIVALDQSLTPEEEAKLENDLLAEFRDHSALRAARESAAGSAQELRYAEGEQQATALLFSGTLRQADLLEMVLDDKIKPSVARALQNELDSPAHVAKSDPTELATVEINLLRYEEQDIWTNQKLTVSDRSRLIQKRRDEAQGWKSTQTAREAFDRIDRALDIVPGVDPDSLTAEELRMRDQALTELYDTIDALPPEERQAALMAKSQEVIENRVRATAREQLRAKRERRQQYIDMAGDLTEMSKTERERFDADLEMFYDKPIAELENRAR